MNNEYLLDRFDDIGQQCRSVSVLIRSLCEFADDNRKRRAIVQAQKKLLYFEKVDIGELKRKMMGD